MAAELELEREVRIAAAPETIFEFLVDPQKFTRWIGQEATLDPRPGGIFRLDFGGGDVAVGEFVEVDRPRKVVFTWGWEADAYPPGPGESTVELILEPDGAETRVRLRHYGLPDEAAVHDHGVGWDEHLASLVEVGAKAA